MNILVKDIPVEGLNVSFQSSRDTWFHWILRESLEAGLKEGDKGSGEFFLLKTGENIDCRGELHFNYHPTCARCLKEFISQYDIPIHLTLAPFFEQSKDEEFIQDDIDFSFFDGVSFDLGNIIREQIILSLPITPYCDENCKGLCQFCGKDLNKGPCGCKAKPKERPFAVLKTLQKKQKV